jgi:hypothetical protein
MKMRRVDEEMAGAAVGHHGRQLLRRGMGRQRRHRGAGAQAADEHGHVFQRVGRAGRDRCAGLDAIALQRCGDAVRHGVELGPADAALALDQRGLRRPGGGVLRDEVGDRLEGWGGRSRWHWGMGISGRSSSNVRHGAAALARMLHR